jgi:hypothetical protein
MNAGMTPDSVAEVHADRLLLEDDESMVLNAFVTRAGKEAAHPSEGHVLAEHKHNLVRLEATDSNVTSRQQAELVEASPQIETDSTIATSSDKTAETAGAASSDVASSNSIAKIESVGSMDVAASDNTTKIEVEEPDVLAQVGSGHLTTARYNKSAHVVWSHESQNSHMTHAEAAEATDKHITSKGAYEETLALVAAGLGEDEDEVSMNIIVASICLIVFLLVCLTYRSLCSDTTSDSERPELTTKLIDAKGNVQDAPLSQRRDLAAPPSHREASHPANGKQFGCC